MSSSVVVRGTFLVVKPYSRGESCRRVNVSGYMSRYGGVLFSGKRGGGGGCPTYHACGGGCTVVGVWEEGGGVQACADYGLGDVGGGCHASRHLC